MKTPVTVIAAGSSLCFVQGWSELAPSNSVRIPNPIARYLSASSRFQ